MHPQFLRFFHAAYVNSRRTSHSLLKRFPLVDRVIGDPLRSLTRTWEGEIVSRTLSNPIRVDSHLLFHRREDAALVSRVQCDTYEKEVYQQFLGVLRPGMTMIDVGAHIGWYSLLAAHLVGRKGRVYAFEAVPETSEILRKNMLANGYEHVTVLPCAVSNKVGRFSLFVDELISSSSSLFPIDLKENVVEVETTTLDNFFQHEGWPSIDLIKIDIEGAEKLALDGMRELSRRNPALKMIVEVNLRKYAFEELIDALKACGFHKFYALELAKTFIAPEEIPSIAATSRSITVNLLCEKATGAFPVL